MGRRGGGGAEQKRQRAPAASLSPPPPLPLPPPPTNPAHLTTSGPHRNLFTLCWRRRGGWTASERRDHMVAMEIVCVCVLVCDHKLHNPPLHLMEAPLQPPTGGKVDGTRLI